MNGIPKAVVSRTRPGLHAWSNSTSVEGDVTGELPRLLERGDVVVAGSIGLVRALIDKDLVDEYRLLVFPTVLGAGRTLFGQGTPPGDLRLLSVEQSGGAVLMRHERIR
jgi:dihydrofolate reductase